MSRYYLMSQLPALDAVDENTPIPITEELFNELCDRFLDKRSVCALEKLTLIPSREPEKAASSLINKWNEKERELRLALGSIRAAKRNKEFDAGNVTFSPEVLTAAKTAVEMEDPLASERFLNRYRLELLEALRPLDAFSEDSVYYYGLKLKLILRINRFDPIKGRDAYKSIYGSVIRKDEQEARQ